MKQILAFFLLASVAFGQNSTLLHYSDVFVPKTLTAGTLMSGRTSASSYDDTTRAFNTRGYAAVYVGIETATNDSSRTLLSYQYSKDGANFSALVLLDSLSSVTLNDCKYFALPATVLGAYSARVRVYGDGNVLRYSANPSTKVTTKIIRVPFNLQKIQ